MSTALSPSLSSLAHLNEMSNFRPDAFEKVGAATDICVRVEDTKKKPFEQLTKINVVRKLAHAANDGTQRHEAVLWGKILHI